MRLELRRVSVPADGARDARRTWTERRSLLLRCADADGAYGVGEASPLPGYSRDELGAVEAALRSLAPTAVARALEQSPVRAALGALAQLLPEALPSARMALETAGLDLLGRRRGTPAPELLGASPGARRSLAALLGPASAPTSSRDAALAVAQGFRHLKLKLGAPDQLRAELEAVVRLRAELGPEIGLRLDANGAFTAAELEEAWQVVGPLGVELFEEPGDIPEHLIGALPLGLDESLQGLREAEVDELLRRSRARCLVLKPTALGGLEHCWRLAERAQQAGASVVVSHCFDGPFAWRASAALALALPPGAAHGLGPHPGLTAWQLASEPLRDGALEAWTEPGLGCSARHAFS